MTESQIIDNMLDMMRVPHFAGSTRMTRIERIAFALSVYQVYGQSYQPSEDVLHRARARQGR